MSKPTQWPGCLVADEWFHYSNLISDMASVWPPDPPDNQAPGHMVPRGHSVADTGMSRQTSKVHE